MSGRKPGLILVNKPAGITSFQMLSPLKKIFGTKKIGHAGTLDKFASGLMLVFVASATRFAQYCSGLDKTYETVFKFGSETDTLDPEGTVIASAAPPKKSELESILAHFRGDIQQSPPEYSAIHIDGTRAYKRVLAGEKIKMPTRRVHIRDLQFLDYDGELGRFLISCSKGTYVRSLARDIAIACGSRAHVTNLKRVSVGQFDISQAVDFNSLIRFEIGDLESKLLWGRQLIDKIEDIEALDLNASCLAKVCHGQRLLEEDIAARFPLIQNTIYAGINKKNNIVALLQFNKKDNYLKYMGVFSSIDNPQ